MLNQFESEQLKMLINLVHEFENLDEARFLEIELDTDEPQVIITDRADIARNKNLYFEGYKSVTIKIQDDEFFHVKINGEHYGSITFTLKQTLIGVISNFIVKDCFDRSMKLRLVKERGYLINYKTHYLMFDCDQKVTKLKIGDIVGKESFMRITKILPRDSDLAGRFKPSYKFQVQQLETKTESIATYGGKISLFKEIK